MELKSFSLAFDCLKKRILLENYLNHSLALSYVNQNTNSLISNNWLTYKNELNVPVGQMNELIVNFDNLYFYLKEGGSFKDGHELYEKLELKFNKIYQSSEKISKQTN
ncbi:hypothetical protein [Gelidibacter salicanalis]|uniref:Uncharacterized protein n=1 Tax=Gelidibacter salicanalis TaxID=291193 RepID=A0A934KJP8_9FLAO|nr:hypothetical protein [Gelidibacter salicanalis]MBJ7880716.1 hypothetical protein [Gelidibacter salicanalis]